MTSKTNSDFALGDVRATSYNAATANPYGYMGTIDDAIAQIKAEPDEARGYWPMNISRQRHELLGFLGVHRRNFSGVQAPGPERPNPPCEYGDGSCYEDWSVEYGAPEAPAEPGKYTLERAMRDWPQNFKQQD
jgi:hypothetical protein